MEKHITIQDLEYYYSHHHLTDYLKTLSDEQLNQVYGLILANDIIGERANLADAIINELDYRNSDELFVSRTK